MVIAWIDVSFTRSGNPIIIKGLLALVKAFLDARFAGMTNKGVG